MSPEKNVWNALRNQEKQQIESWQKDLTAVDHLMEGQQGITLNPHQQMGKELNHKLPQGKIKEWLVRIYN